MALFDAMFVLEFMCGLLKMHLDAYNSLYNKDAPHKLHASEQKASFQSQVLMTNTKARHYNPQLFTISPASWPMTRGVAAFWNRMKGTTHNNGRWLDF